ncbi:acyl-CoA dehydrogenase family protein, partial [Streptomyces massasporeus]
MPPEADPYREAAREAVAPATGLDPAAARRVLAPTGYAAPHLPEPYGLGAGPLQQLAVQRALDEAGITVSGLGIATWVVPSLLAHGTPAQQEEHLGPTLRGERLWCQLFSEPGAGSDAAALALEARPDGTGGWRLYGEKRWISNAPEADFATVFARTTPDAGARGVTAFLVPADRPGLGGEALDMLAPHALGTLTFDGVPVGPDDLLGEPDRGFRVAMNTLNLFRPSVGAFAVGMAQAALDAALAHTADRPAFGGHLADLQSVAHRIAEMATRTEAARLLVYAAAGAYDDGDPDVPRRSAMAKL